MGAAYIPSSMNIKALLAVALLVVALTAAFDNCVDEDFLESNPESSLAQALPPSKPKCHKKCGVHTKCRKHYVRIPGRGYKCYCPSTMKKGKWLNNGRHKHAQDIFKVTTKGQGVQVKRVDKAGRNCHGWGMNLTFMCKCRRLPKRT